MTASVRAGRVFVREIPMTKATTLVRTRFGRVVATVLLAASAAACGGRSLLNFNPLMKSDGYYVLSDWM